ncbi:MAG: IPT/TIG domain-containing protein [bacterium]|nr:IPT/TIG domain-containing protein [bacterium]
MKSIKHLSHIIEKFHKKLLKNKALLPTLLLITATIIIIIVGYLFAQKEKRINQIQKNNWTTKTGIYIPLEISSFSPKQGATEGKNIITISGRGFNSNIQLYIGSKSNINQRSFKIPIKITSETSLKATMPPHPPGQVDIFTYFNGNLISTSDQYTYLGQQVRSTSGIQINTISPEKIGLISKANITISGSGFTKSNTIHFGQGILKNIPAQNSTTIKFPLPASIETPIGVLPIMVGKYDISVETNSKESNIITLVIT